MKRNFFGEPVFSMEDGGIVLDTLCRLPDELIADINWMDDDDHSAGLSITLKDAETLDDLGHVHDVPTTQEAFTFLAEAGLETSQISDYREEAA